MIFPYTEKNGYSAMGQSSYIFVYSFLISRCSAVISKIIKNAEINILNS